MSPPRHLSIHERVKRFKVYIPPLVIWRYCWNNGQSERLTKKSWQVRFGGVQREFALLIDYSGTVYHLVCLQTRGELFFYCSFLRIKILPETSIVYIAKGNCYFDVNFVKCSVAGVCNTACIWQWRHTWFQESNGNW